MLEEAMNLTFLDMLCGIGGFRLGLERLGWKCLGSIEIDPYCRRTYEANFDVSREFFWNDATSLDTGSLPDFDLLASGFPCQPFSVAGKRKGFDDLRGTLFFEIARVLEAKRPRFFLLENVKGLLSEPMKPCYDEIVSTLRALGYAVSINVLNSRDYGVPQNRERVFFVGFRSDTFQQREFPWPPPVPRKAVLSDVLEENPDPKYDLSPRMVETLLRHMERARARGSGWGLRILTGLDSAPTIPETYYKGPGGAGRPAVMSPAVSATAMRSMTALATLDPLNRNQDSTIGDGDEMRTITGRHGLGLGVAVNTTSPHWKGDERHYHPSEQMRTLMSDSTGTNFPIVMQVKRYHADGNHELREYDDVSPTLTRQLGTGGHNIPIIAREDSVPILIRASSAMSEIGKHRVNLVRDSSPSLMSGGNSGWASYENAVAVNAKGPGNISEPADHTAPVTAAGSRSQLATIQGLRLRRLTPRECARLQSFPDSFVLPCSDHRSYMQMGNAVTVSVITAIGRSIERWLAQ